MKILFHVYILVSRDHPDQIYIGCTQHLKNRLHDHNRKHVTHTRKFAPWKCVFYATFPSKSKALAFEAYLKSHSGRAFLKKRLIP